jgi:hypothetical protein
MHLIIPLSTSHFFYKKTWFHLKFDVIFNMLFLFFVCLKMMQKRYFVLLVSTKKMPLIKKKTSKDF